MTGSAGSARVAAVLALAAALTRGVSSLHAQGALDRSRVPTPAAPPRLRVPPWTTIMLPNGARLVVVEKHDLPLIACNIDFVGGSTVYEPADKVGLAGFTAQMLSEGTSTRTADQLSDAQQMLGTAIFAQVGPETGTIRFTSLSDKFEPALALLADMMLHSTFPDSSLERIRGRALVALTQARDQPNTIAANIFSKVTYGDVHPYGRVATQQSAQQVTRADVIQFAATYFRPGRAVITVSGDITPAAARAAVEKVLGDWPAGGARPAFDYPPVPARRPTTIYLVDKPRAAQSVFAFGEPGPARDTPDYYSVQVMNTLLGGLFQSRLNHDIREVKGFSYGVGSSFAFGRGPGPFTAGGDIVSAKTDSALMAFMTHFRGVRGDMPFTDDEMKQGKESLIQSLPSRFSTVNGTAAAISSIYVEDLPPTYYATYAARINAVTRNDLTRVARKYIDLQHINLVIVGDRATIEGPLKATGIAPVQILDADGKPVVIP